MTTNFFSPLSFIVVFGSEIRNPGCSSRIRNTAFDNACSVARRGGGGGGGGGEAAEPAPGEDCAEGAGAGHRTREPSLHTHGRASQPES